MKLTRFRWGMLGALITGMIYFVAVSIATPSLPIMLSPVTLEADFCPPDESFAEWLTYDWSELVSVPSSQDEALLWGLLSPDTSVFMDYAPSSYYITNIDSDRLLDDCLMTEYVDFEPDSSSFGNMRDCQMTGSHTWH
jgi:hypothetical protein